jgi:carbamoylphosphate synthase small subunit
LKDVDSRVVTTMLRKDGRQRYYIPSQIRWRGDNKNNTMDNKVHKTKTIQWTIKYTRQNNIMEMHFETFMFLLL